MRQNWELQMFGARGCEAGGCARESFDFFRRRSFEVCGVGAERGLSFAFGAKWGANFAGSWVDGYRNALRYGDYADFGVYDFGGLCEGEVGI